MSHAQITHPRTLRAPVGILTVLALGTAFAVLPTVAAHAATTSAASTEAAFLSDTNAARAAAGLARYSVSSDLVSVARTHSRAMAASQTLYHNPALATAITNWQAVGENVGDGPTEADLQSAFMHSPEHRSNILDRDFTQVGIGVTIDSHGTVWVTLDFRQPLHAAKTTTAPRPVATHAATVTKTPVRRVVTVVHRAAPSAPVKHPRTVAVSPTQAVAHAITTASRPPVATQPLAAHSQAVAMSALAPSRSMSAFLPANVRMLLRPEILLLLLALALVRVRGHAVAVRRNAAATV